MAVLSEEVLEDGTDRVERPFFFFLSSVTIWIETSDYLLGREPNSACGLPRTATLKVADLQPFSVQLSMIVRVTPVFNPMVQSSNAKKAWSLVGQLFLSVANWFASAFAAENSALLFPHFLCSHAASLLLQRKGLRLVARVGLLKIPH